MKKTLASQVVGAALNVTTLSGDTSDLVTNIVDLGDCQNATAIITYNASNSKPITAVTFWTSTSDDCITSGTAQSATTNTVQVEIASDVDSLQSWTTPSDAKVDLSVSSNVIASIAEDCITAVELPNTRRYVVMAYNGHSDQGTLAVTIVGRDPSGSDRPWTAARTAY